MSIIKIGRDGKYQLDWGAAVTLFVSLLTSGTITGFGSYYAIKYDIRQQDYRLTQQEYKVIALETTVNAIRLKDAGDTEAFKNVCASLNEIKVQLGEIRRAQKR